MKQLASAIILFIVLFSGKLFSQSATWTNGIAELVYHHCTGCHNPGGIGPFALETYDDAVNWSTPMRTYVSTRKMPPWSPDITYRHYANERALLQSQVDSIVNWIDSGTPLGDSLQIPVAPHFNNGPVLGTPDLKLTIPTHVSQAGTSDEYACFILPVNIPYDKYVRAIQIIPGNRAIVHHVVVIQDTTAAQTDCMLNILGDVMTSWAAGMSPTVFPNGAGIKLGERLKKGSNIMLQIHYPLGTAGQSDSTSLLFYFYSDSEVANPNPPLRIVEEGLYVMNWLFYIAPNTTQTINAQYPTVGQTTQDISLFSVDPHMHLVGRTMLAFAVTPNGDTIPLSRVNNWQFSWQGYYTFRNLIKIPAGSMLYGSAYYDNTANNPYNPNHPPQAILPGEQTTNEMMLIAFQYTAYQAGDENYNVDSLVTLPSNIISSVPEVYNPVPAKNISFNIYPNPGDGQFILSPVNLQQGTAEITITDILGQAIYNKEVNNLHDPLNLDISSNPDGIYLVQVKKDHYYSAQRIILARR